MPTITKAEPVNPSKKFDFLGNLAFGKKQHSLIFRPFSKQWSQPELILLARVILETNALHSSQIDGIQKETLRDPSPKLLVALGLVNLALARTLGVDVAKGKKIPAQYKHLYENKEYMRNADGTPMGPTDMFNAFSGLIDLGISNARTIPVRKEKAVSKALGKYMRIALAKLDIDYISESMELKKKSKTIDKLIYNKPVSGASIIADISNLAKLAQQDEEDIWGIAIAPNLN